MSLETPDAAVIARAAEVIRRGGIVAIPTDTLYGLAADPFNVDAVQRVFAIKGREAGRALPLIAADTAQVERAVGDLGTLARSLASRFWPGPLTLLMRAPAALAAVAAGTDRVGVRVPAHPIARALCVQAARPLTATSANISGQPPTDDPDVVARAFGDRIDLLLDAGRTPGGAASTIVDVTGAAPRLVREGATLWDEVQACATRA